MKKFVLMTALAVSMAASAAEVSDTTVIDKADKITIMTTDTAQRVTVFGKQGDNGYVYDQSVPLNKWKMKKKKENKDDADEPSEWDFDLGLGIGVPTSVPDGMSFSPFKSLEWLLGLRYVYTPKNASQSYSTGLWCNWRDYGLSDSKMFVKGVNDVVELGQFLEGASSKRSSINVFSLSVPFLFTQSFGQKRNFKVTLGPVVCFNLYGRINYSYELGDDNISVNTKGIEYRPVTIDIMGMFTYKKISAYCKYSPMSVLKKDKGPQFHSLTFGVFL